MDNTSNETRNILVQLHPALKNAKQILELVTSTLARNNINILYDDAIPDDESIELVLVLGGDGSVLKATEYSRLHNIPVLGINYGHVGFLTEANPDDLHVVLDRIATKDYRIVDRMTVEMTLLRPDGEVFHDWALNEFSVERAPDSRSFEVSIGIDNHELSSFMADAILFSTPTGSTAYNFSAGGPVVWPNVEGMILTPIAAHALFTRPLVVGPSSKLELHVLGDPARVWADYRRSLIAPKGSIITVIKGASPVKLARFMDTPFTGRLVDKFQLPVKGWR